MLGFSDFWLKVQLSFTQCHILGLLCTLNFCRSDTKIIQIIHQDDTETIPCKPMAVFC